MAEGTSQIPRVSFTEEGKTRRNRTAGRFARFLPRRKDVPVNEQGRETVEALGLGPRHLRRLKRRFDAIDIDGSGNIDYDELFEELQENRSSITDALFRLIDEDSSGTIEFNEFVRLCATYCVYSKEEILKFCFDCFDKDGSGSIDETEYRELCKTVNSPGPLFPGNFAQAVAMFDTNNDGVIDFDEFVDLDRRYPLILFPAFRLQDRMQKITLGEKTWTRINEAIAEATFVNEYEKNNGGQTPYVPVLRRMKGMVADFFGWKHHVSFDKIKALRERPRTALSE